MPANVHRQITPPDMHEGRGILAVLIGAFAVDKRPGDKVLVEVPIAVRKPDARYLPQRQYASLRGRTRSPRRLLPSAFLGPLQ